MLEVSRRSVVELRSDGTRRVNRLWQGLARIGSERIGPTRGSHGIPLPKSHHHHHETARSGMPASAGSHVLGAAIAISASFYIAGTQQVLRSSSKHVAYVASVASFKCQWDLVLDLYFVSFL